MDNIQHPGRLYIITDIDMETLNENKTDRYPAKAFLSVEMDKKSQYRGKGGQAIPVNFTVTIINRDNRGNVSDIAKALANDEHKIYYVYGDEKRTADIRPYGVNFPSVLTSGSSSLRQRIAEKYNFVNLVNNETKGETKSEGDVQVEHQPEAETEKSDRPTDESYKRFADRIFSWYESGERTTEETKKLSELGANFICFNLSDGCHDINEHLCHDRTNFERRYHEACEFAQNVKKEEVKSANNNKITEAAELRGHQSPTSVNLDDHLNDSIPTEKALVNPQNEILDKRKSTTLETDTIRDLSSVGFNLSNAFPESIIAPTIKNINQETTNNLISDVQLEHNSEEEYEEEYER